MKIFSVSEMNTAERTADAAGLPYAMMMETAGRGVFEALTARHDIKNKGVLILVGPGNNGGDALVTGRYLHEAGAKVIFYLAKQRPEADVNLERANALNLNILYAEHDHQYRVLRMRMRYVDIVIDGLLGTGLSRPISGSMARLMRQVSAGIDERHRILETEWREAERAKQGVPIVSVNRFSASPLTTPPRPIVVAVDCPSGLNCDTGACDPLTLTADLTVTFAGPKHGHLLYPGADSCGELVVADIGLEPAHTENVMAELVTPQLASTFLPKRPSDGHKGTFGRLLIAAGSDEYRGAPLLAAKGAFRAGAGLVALAIPEVVRDTAVVQLPEATFPPISAPQVLDHSAEQLLFADLKKYQAILLGPGMGHAESFIMSFLTELSQEDLGRIPATVLDADALNVLARRDDWPHLMQPNMILTPHPGELARLMNIPLSALKGQNRILVTQEQAQKWGCVVLLKGAYTVVAAPDGSAFVLPFANPILSTAGSGDVLSGVITALLGQGAMPYEAAVLGAYLHGMAGQLASEKWGDAGLLAREMADYIPLARKQLQV